MSVIEHTLPPHMERVVEEKKELQLKMDKLHALLTDQPRIERLNVNAPELARLRRQYVLMGLYRDTLAERLEAAV